MDFQIVMSPCRLLVSREMVTAEVLSLPHRPQLLHRHQEMDNLKEKRVGWQLSQPSGKHRRGTISVAIMKTHKAEGEHALQSCVENEWYINTTIIAL